jgi:hypothetical protein
LLAPAGERRKAVQRPGDALVGRDHRAPRSLDAAGNFQPPLWEHRLTGGVAAYIVDTPNPQLSRKMANHVGWIRWLPGLLTLRRYQASWLGNDIVAGWS